MSHPDTAKSYNSLAMCHYHLFNYNEAKENLEISINIKTLFLETTDESLLSMKRSLKEINKMINKSNNRGLFSRFLNLFKFKK